MKERFLTLLRDRSLPLLSFREASSSLSKLMALEISQSHAHQEIILVPILRAGLALLPAFQEVFPSAPIGFIGIKRDEATALPALYYQNLPPTHNRHVLLLDPMLATGGSANLAIDLLDSPSHITLISIIAAPTGLHAVKSRHPTVEIYTVATDKGLDGKKYIVPGLGDYGDRYFGTTN